MTNNRSKIDFPHLPVDFPRSIYSEIYSLTNKEDTSGNFRCFKGEYSYLSVWHAMRSVYIYFKDSNNTFNYQHDFANYKEYSPYEVVEYLRDILNETEKAVKQKIFNREIED